jgi:hypothetical protein
MATVCVLVLSFGVIGYWTFGEGTQVRMTMMIMMMMMMIRRRRMVMMMMMMMMMMMINHGDGLRAGAALRRHRLLDLRRGHAGAGKR